MITLFLAETSWPGKLSLIINAISFCLAWGASRKIGRRAEERICGPPIPTTELLRS